MTSKERIEKIRDFLRYHSEYSVQLEFFSLYGTMVVQIYEKGELIYSNYGNTLEKRLKVVEEYFGL